MSLINDALKRASQTEKNRARVPAPAPLMQATCETRRSGFPFGIVVCVILLLATSGGLIFRYFVPHQAASAVLAPVAAIPPAAVIVPKVEPRPAPMPLPLSSPNPNLTPTSTPNPNPNPIIANALPAKSNPPIAPPAPVAATPPPPFPELKLQGIFFTRTNPKVIINGQTRGENEKIGEVRIAKIYADKVTLEWQGQTNTLRLESQ